MGQSVLLELGRWNGHHAGSRQRVAQALGIDEENGLVLEDGSAQGSRVLVGDGTSARRVGGVIEEIVGVEYGVVVILGQVAVKLVGAGLGHEVHLYARHAAVLGAVSVQDHGGFGDLVGAERVVAGPGFVVVVVRLGDIRSVHRIQTRIEGQTVGVEVVVAASHVEPEPRRGEGEVGDVAAVHRQTGQLPRAVGGGLVSILRLYQTRFRQHLDALLGALYG